MRRAAPALAWALLFTLSCVGPDAAGGPAGSPEPVAGGNTGSTGGSGGSAGGAGGGSGSGGSPRTPTPPGAGGSATDAGPAADAAKGSTADGGANTTPADAAARPDAVASSGCGSGTPPPNGSQTIVVGGKTRSYIVRAPKPYEPTRPYPIVFAFHGFQQTGAFLDTNSGPPYNFKAVFGAVAIVVYPTALPNANGDNSWARDINDDVAFFDAMLATVKSQACVDAGRVIAVGHSNGAVFANVLGCRRGDVLRGFGPVEGGLGTTSGCTAQTTAAFIVHGEKDMLVSIGTGIRSRDYWLMRNGCSSQNPMPVMPAPCVMYQGCRPGAPVVWCQHQETAYNGTGHGWPPWATAGMWTFFSGN